MTLKLNDPAVHEIISETLGEDHLEIMKQLSQPKYDEDIAEEIGLKATVVRTLLNDLHAKSLVEYERIKNKSTGWYTYIWKKREDNLENYLKDYLAKRLKELNKKLEKEKNGVFKCSCSIVSLEEALEKNFFCSTCGEKFVKYDNSKVVKELKSEIKKTKAWYDKL